MLISNSNAGRTVSLLLIFALIFSGPAPAAFANDPVPGEFAPSAPTVSAGNPEGSPEGSVADEGGSNPDTTDFSMGGSVVGDTGDEDENLVDEEDFVPVAFVDARPPRLELNNHFELIITQGTVKIPYDISHVVNVTQPGGPLTFEFYGSLLPPPAAGGNNPPQLVFTLTSAGVFPGTTMHEMGAIVEVQPGINPNQQQFVNVTVPPGNEVMLGHIMPLYDTATNTFTLVHRNDRDVALLELQGR